LQKEDCGNIIYIVFACLVGLFYIKDSLIIIMKNPLSLHYFRSGYRRIKRFIVWFPIIWKDEDWDPENLFEIMKFKISRMRKVIDKNKIVVGYEKLVRDMKVAEEILDRLSSGDFYYDQSKQFEKRYKIGKCICPEKTYSFEPDFLDCEGKVLGSRMVDLSCDYCKKMNPIWYKIEYAKQKADFDFLFEHLRKNVRKWWD